MKQGFKLTRRAVLQGLGGVAVALPVLECMLNSRGTHLAGAATALPRRYGIVFAGQAIGGDEWPKDQQRIAGKTYTEAGHFIAPSQYGADYVLTTPLTPLSALRSEVSVVSGLGIPYNKNSEADSDVPAGGAYRGFHGGAKSPLLCGTRSTSEDFRCNSVTSDQMVATLHAGQTLFPSLIYRAQPSWYLAGSSFSGRQYISYGEGGKAIEAQSSPLVAYQALFAGFAADPSMVDATLDFRRRARISVLDLVQERRAQVLLGLGRGDTERLQRHYDELRDLEKRVDATTTLSGGSCQRPSMPADDPAIGGDNAGSGSEDIATNTGYSNEQVRARLLADLTHMALVCDLTRVFTLQLTVFQSHMNVFSITSDLGLPIRADLHEVGHNGDANNRGQLAVSTCLKWHVQHYAYLLDKLRNTKEGDGSLLDNSAVFFMPEGGHGTQLNDAVSENQTHSVEQMVLLLAGRAGGLQPGLHLDGRGYHPAQVLLSGMQAAGHTTTSFGEVSGSFPGVFG